MICQSKFTGYRYTSSRNVPIRYISPRNVPPRQNRIFFWFVAALFRFVARFAHVRIEDSSGNSFTSTAYFAKPGFIGGGMFRGETTEMELSWGNFPEGNISVTNSLGLQWLLSTCRYWNIIQFSIRRKIFCKKFGYTIKN